MIQNENWDLHKEIKCTVNSKYVNKHKTFSSYFNYCKR